MPNNDNAPGFPHLYERLISQVLDGEGYSSKADRQAAFNNAGLADPLKTLIDKTANQAYRVSDSDINAVKQSGVKEEQIFELVICAAIGQSSRQYRNALAALDEVVKERGGNHAS